MRMILSILLLATATNAGEVDSVGSSASRESGEKPTVLVLDSAEGEVRLDVDDPEAPKDDQEDDKGCCATMFSCESWKKMFSPSQQTPKPLRRFFGGLTWTALGLAVFVPYIRHHDLGWMNGHLVETISGTLATHPVWAKTWGTIGASFGVLAFWNLWKKDLKEAETPEKWADNETSKCCAKTLTWTSLASWTFGSVANLGVLWFPIGGKSSTMHKYFTPAFFIPTAIGMVFYAWISKKKHGWRNWRFFLFSILALLTVAFAVGGMPIKDQKYQMKMPQDDCLRESPNSPEICLAEHNILVDDSVHGNCRTEIPNYGNPHKTPCDVDLSGSLADAEAACEATTRKGEQCHLTQTKMTGWYKNIGLCESNNKELQGPGDTCRDASARNNDGKIDNDAFETSCGATIDTAGNACDYVPASVSEKYWTIWSVFEVVGFSGAFLTLGFLLIGK